MKIKLGFLVLLAGLFFVACDSKDAQSSNKIIVGATPSPHGVILEKVKPILSKDGITLEIKEFTDYVLPNEALAEGSLDANFFQHRPYLENSMKEKKGKYDFVEIGAVHIEPMGLYSKKYKSLDELPSGATVILSNSVSDWPRVLRILEKAGILKLKDGAIVDFNDIESNPKNLVFKYDLDPAMLMSAYNNKEGDIVAINSNFAVDQGLNPIKDAIFMEGAESPFVNILVAQSKDKNSKELKALLDVLTSKEIQDFIISEWNGAVVPVK